MDVKTRVFKVVFFLIVCFGFDDRRVEATIVDAVIFGGQLLCVNEKGKVALWVVGTNELDPTLLSILSSRKIDRIATDGSTLWTISGNALLSLSAPYEGWVEVSQLAAGQGPVIDLFALASEPVVVYPTAIVRPMLS